MQGKHSTTVLYPQLSSSILKDIIFSADNIIQIVGTGGRYQNLI